MYVIGIKTVFFRVRVTRSPAEIGRGRVSSLIVRNPLTNSDGTGNTTMILVGDGQTQPYDLLPGQDTPLIYAEDLKDVYVRVLVPEVGDPADTDCIIVAHREPQPVNSQRGC